MSDSGNNPLRSELEHWNEVTSMRYQQCLESLTDLALEDARRHLELFATMLRSSMDFVDQRLDELQQEADDAIRMLRADHLILGRTISLAEQALEQLDHIAGQNSNSLRAEMVQRLDIFVRLNNILRQHQLRQRDSLFPLLETSIDHDKGEKLAQLFTRSMQRAGPH